MRYHQYSGVEWLALYRDRRWFTDGAKLCNIRSR